MHAFSFNIGPGAGPEFGKTLCHYQKTQEIVRIHAPEGAHCVRVVQVGEYTVHLQLLDPEMKPRGYGHMPLTLIMKIDCLTEDNVQRQTLEKLLALEAKAP